MTDQKAKVLLNHELELFENWGREKYLDLALSHLPLDYRKGVLRLCKAAWIGRAAIAKAAKK